MSKYILFTCDERGNLARYCPIKKDRCHKRKGNKKIHLDHVAEDDEPSKKRIKQDSDEKYVLISALTGNITHGSNDWIIESESPKHMMGFRDSLVKLSEHESPHKVKLGDD